MRTIGIRAAPKEVTFAIYDSDSEKIINVEEIKIPAAFSVPDALKYVRSNLLDVLREYEVSKAGVRVCEANAQSPSIERIQIEGVIQEAFASSELISYYIGRVSSISSRAGIDKANFKPMVKGEIEYDVDGWSEMPQERREAVLCAVGAVNV